jgi:hypothetical protein
MHSSYPPLVDAYLIVDQPRQRLSHWSQALAPLDDPRAPALAAVTAYYDPQMDQALIGVRYDELALGEQKLSFVVEIALLAEIGMIQPLELTEGDRKRFLGERLQRCSIHVTAQRTAVGALTELVRYLRDQRPSPVRGQQPVVQIPPKSARASLTPSGEMPVAPPVTSKGTRDDLSPHNLPPPPRVTRPYAQGRPKTKAERAPTVDMPPLEAQRLVAKSAQLGRAAAVPIGGGTVEALQARRAPIAPPAPPVGRRNEVDTEPYLPTTNGPVPPGMIYARFLRSGRWVPVRIGALSLKGAALLSGALPRTADHVDLALTYGEHRALVRGPVSKVSTAEETSTTGTATFSVKFELDDASRRQLVALLTAARNTNVTIKPPPPRLARRFPVEWPVCLGTMRGAVRAEALDISRDGMFVRPIHALSLDANVNFSCVIDDGQAPLSGRAKVVRHVTAANAQACGLVAGYGLKLVDMGDADRARWLEFLTRVERRTEKRVLVGASPARLAEIQNALAGSGYAVTGATDPGALVQLASTEPRPVDAALIDATWLSPGQSATWVESLFSARNVPCVTMHGDVRRARVVIDKLLSVGEDGRSQRG